jgi:hypothetical protein
MRQDRIIVVALMGVLMLLLAVDGGRRGHAAEPLECPCWGDAEEIIELIGEDVCDFTPILGRQFRQIHYVLDTETFTLTLSAFHGGGSPRYSCVGVTGLRVDDLTSPEYAACLSALRQAATAADCT